MPTLLKGHHAMVPGLLLHQIGRWKRLIRHWRTKALYFPSLLHSLWHVDHGKPAAVIRAFWFGWLTRIGKDGVTGGRLKDWLGTKPEAGSEADWDLNWLGLPDPCSERFGYYETKEKEREVRNDGNLAWNNVTGATKAGILHERKGLRNADISQWKKNQIYLTISKWLNTYWLEWECNIHDSGLVMCKPGSEDLKRAAATVERVIGITTHFCVHKHPPPHFLFHIQYGGLCWVLISMYRHTSPASCYFCPKRHLDKAKLFCSFFVVFHMKYSLAV